MISKNSLRVTVCGVATAAAVGLAGAASASACTPAAAAPRPASLTQSACEAHGGHCAPAVPHGPHSAPAAANQATHAKQATDVKQAAHVKQATHAGITAKPSAKSVRAWQLFHVNGTTTGIKAGSAITLQQKQHGKFVSLPAAMHTDQHGSYRLGVKLGVKGVNELRIVSGHIASPVFTVTVR